MRRIVTSLSMKRIAVAAAAFFSLFGTAYAASSDTNDLPQCRGISITWKMREEARESKTDPAKSYAKKNRTAPPKAACESAMWQQVHLRAGRPARPLSAAGKRASEGSVSAMPYAGPPVDHQPVQGIRTPPLRKIHPLPPPNRGDGHDEGYPEPIRPVPPTEVGRPNGPVDDFFGAQLSAPSPVGSGFAGIG